MNTERKRYETDKHDYEDQEKEERKRKEKQERDSKLEENENYIQKVISDVETDKKKNVFHRYKPDEVELVFNDRNQYLFLRNNTSNCFIDGDKIDIIKSFEINPDVLIGSRRIKLIPDSSRLIFENPFDQFYLKKYFGNRDYYRILQTVNKNLFFDIRTRAGSRGYKCAYVNKIVYRIKEEYMTFNVLVEWSCVKRLDELDNIPRWLNNKDSIYDEHKINIDVYNLIDSITFKNESSYLKINNNNIIKFTMEYIHSDINNCYDVMMTLIKKDFSNDHIENSIKDINKYNIMIIETTNKDKIVFYLFHNSEEAKAIKKNKKKRLTRYIDVLLHTELKEFIMYKGDRYGI